MKLIAINDISNKKCISLLESNFRQITQSNLIKNYHPDFKNQPENIFFNLENNRYSIGNYFILLDNDDNYVCSAGWHRYNDDTALLLTRAYVTDKYRTLYPMAEFILPGILRESKDFKKRWITVNKYNFIMYKWWERAACGKSTSIGNDWPDIYKKFRPIGWQTVNFVEQLVVEYQE